jgi:hypothetical protein
MYVCEHMLQQKIGVAALDSYEHMLQLHVCVWGGARNVRVWGQVGRTQVGCCLRHDMEHAGCECCCRMQL